MEPLFAIGAKLRYERLSSLRRLPEDDINILHYAFYTFQHPLNVMYVVHVVVEIEITMTSENVSTTIH